jgi:hypothetical protein
MPGYNYPAIWYVVTIIRYATPRCWIVTIVETSLPAAWWCANNNDTDDYLFWKDARVGCALRSQPTGDEASDLNHQVMSMPLLMLRLSLMCPSGSHMSNVTQTWSDRSDGRGRSICGVPLKWLCRTVDGQSATGHEAVGSNERHMS